MRGYSQCCGRRERPLCRCSTNKRSLQPIARRRFMLVSQGGWRRRGRRGMRMPPGDHQGTILFSGLMWSENDFVPKLVDQTKGRRRFLAVSFFLPSVPWSSPSPTELKGKSSRKSIKSSQIIDFGARSDDDGGCECIGKPITWLTFLKSRRRRCTFVFESNYQGSQGYAHSCTQFQK